MPVIDPAFALPVTPQRDTGSDGNPNWTNLPATKMVIDLDAPTLSADNGSRYTQNGTIAIPRGYDLRHGDRLKHHGRNYTVVGMPRGDYPHAFTGDDFGWVEVTVSGGV